MEKSMNTLRSGLFFLALVSLICLLAPSSALAQDDSVPPCCNNDMLTLPSDSIIIIDLDTEIPSNEETADEDGISQSVAAGSTDTVAEVAADKTRLVARQHGNPQPLSGMRIKQS
jgi:hypothetical protein